MTEAQEGAVRDETARRGWSPADRVVTAAIVVSGPVLLAHGASRGALGIPRNDDWVFLRDAFTSAAAGRPVLEPWSSAMTVGQVVAAMPVVELLGPSVTALQGAVAVVGGVGLLFTYLFLRRFLAATPAALAVATVLLGPMYGSLAVSFMTEVPTTALIAIALWLAGRAMDRPRMRWAWWGASLGVALAAFTIREYAAAVPVALALTVALTRRPRRDAFGAYASLLLWFVAALGLYLARQRLAVSPWDMTTGLSRLELHPTLQTVTRSVATTALLLLAVVPTLVLAARQALVRRRAVVVVGLGFLVTVGALLLARHRLSGWALPLGNYVSIVPSYSRDTLPGPAPTLFGPRSTSVLPVLGLVSTTAIAFCLALSLWRRRGLAAPRERPGDPWPVLAAVFAVTYVALVVAVAVARGGRPFDRYLLPALPYLAGALLMWTPPLGAASRIGRAVAAAATVGVLAVGYLFVDATAVSDAARWRAGELAAARGTTASTVDAGYEWFGFHQPGLPQRRPDVEAAAAEGANWWVTMYEDAKVCVRNRYADNAVPQTDGVVVDDATWWGFRTAVLVGPVHEECPKG